MKSLNKALLLFVIVICTELHVAAQPDAAVEDAIFWEVTGNGLKQPSYLFGTFHLMDNRYVDSLTNVMAKFNSSQTLASELLMDSTMMMKVMSATQLKGTSLDKLLSAEDYRKTAEWLKELMGYDLAMLNSFNPLTINLLLMAAIQKKYYPMDHLKDISMDRYFQKLAKSNGKKSIGLETLEDQMQILYGQFSYERQAQLLSEYVASKEKAYQETADINTFYREQKLSKMEKIMSDQRYDKKENEIMLDNRNKKWMDVIPNLMKEQSTFVAVGALHLAGKNGVVNLLRKQGYTVRPIALK